MTTPIEKPNRIDDLLIVVGCRTARENDSYIGGYNNACDEWEKYHEQELRKAYIDGQNSMKDINENIEAVYLDAVHKTKNHIKERMPSVEEIEKIIEKVKWEVGLRALSKNNSIKISYACAKEIHKQISEVFNV